MGQTKGSVVGLFAGIGGFEIGLGRAGFPTALLCEIMPEARAVLAQLSTSGHTTAGAKIVSDVTSNELVKGLPEEIEILTAGFPCQDLSQAGRTAGIRGERSGLVGRVFEIVEKRRVRRRPRWIVIENVSFMRHLAAGEGMRYVLSNLSKLGYSWAYREIDALAFGLPQRRKRLFIVACLEGEGDPRAVLFHPETESEGSEPQQDVDWRDGIACGFYWTEGNRGTGFAANAVPTIKGGSGLGIPSPPAIILPDERIVLPHIRDAERLQGFPRGWTQPAAKDDPRRGRIRWKLVGNAVSVPVAEWIGRGIEANGTCKHLPSNRPMRAGEKWPHAAWRMEEGAPIQVASVGDRPVQRQARALLEILEAEQDKVRPPLSLGAAGGFLRRFEASSLLSRSPNRREAFIRLLKRHVDNQQKQKL